MNVQQALVGPPADFREWILLGYVIMTVAGAWLLGRIGRHHFRRAQQLAELGFEYDAALDEYECPEGERLSLHVLQSSARVAVYRAKAESCAGCSRRASCAPHDRRHIYRPLAAWAETDCGRFHQWFAVVMNGGAAVVGGVGIIWWVGQPGTGMLLVATVWAVVSFVTGLLAAREGNPDVADPKVPNADWQNSEADRAVQVCSPTQKFEK
jgi:hypothetical protein